MRPVDADAIYNKALENLRNGEIEDWEFDSIINYLDGAPTLNVETNMRCKDCKHWQRNTGVVDSPNGHCFDLETCTNGLDFCSYGEYQTNTGGGRKCYRLSFNRAACSGYKPYTRKSARS